MEASGKVIAGILGAEAAHVTPGCCAALALGTAACIAGKDRAVMERLPDTTGLKNEVLIQKRGRIKYDRCLTLAGARMVEISDEAGSGTGQTARAHSRFTLAMGSQDDGTWTTSEQIESFIGPRTVAIHYLAQAEGSPGIVPLAEVVRIGRKHHLPIIVDAAGLVYPPQRMCEFPKIGVDLVCFGAKYFNAPNSTGLLVGRRDLVESAMLQSHIGFETTNERAIGRAFKVDRFAVVAAVVALKEWFAMDHATLARGFEAMARAIERGLQGIPGITITVRYYGQEGSSAPQIPNVVLQLPAGKDADAVGQQLREGTPRIFVHVPPGENTISMSVNNLLDGEEDTLVERIRALLTR